VQFLKILFWCLLAFAAALFTYGNWNAVPIHLWGGLIADVNLPLLLLVTFLIGFIPTHLYHLAIRWRLRQRLATTERQLADARTVLMAPAPARTVAEPVIAEPASPAEAVAPTPAEASPPPGQLL